MLNFNVSVVWLDCLLEIPIKHPWNEFTQSTMKSLGVGPIPFATCLNEVSFIEFFLGGEI